MTYTYIQGLLEKLIISESYAVKISNAFYSSNFIFVSDMRVFSISPDIISSFILHHNNLNIEQYWSNPGKLIAVLRSLKDWGIYFKNDIGFLKKKHDYDQWKIRIKVVVTMSKELILSGITKKALLLLLGKLKNFYPFIPE